MVTDRLIKPTRMRSAVAKSMSISATVPQFVVDRDIDPTALQALRDELSDRPSMADLINFAVVRALVQHPRLNGSWQDGQIVEYEDVNLGVAIAVEDGIIAPAILRSQDRALEELGAARKDLQNRSGLGTLTIEEMTSATFTISNLGTTGVSRVQPLVIPPQAAILGVAAPRRSGELTLCLACDHRVTDGLPAAQFLSTLAESLESPDWLRGQ